MIAPEVVSGKLKIVLAEYENASLPVHVVYQEGRKAVNPDSTLENWGKQIFTGRYRLGILRLTQQRKWLDTTNHKEVPLFDILMVDSGLMNLIAPLI